MYNNIITIFQREAVPRMDSICQLGIKFVIKTVNIKSEDSMFPSGIKGSIKIKKNTARTCFFHAKASWMKCSNQTWWSSLL